MSSAENNTTFLKKFGAPPHTPIDMIPWLDTILQEAAGIRESIEALRESEQSDLSSALLPPRLRKEIATYWGDGLKDLDIFIRPHVAKLGELMALDPENEVWARGTSTFSPRVNKDMLELQQTLPNSKDPKALRKFTRNFVLVVLDEGRDVVIPLLATYFKNRNTNTGFGRFNRGNT